MLEVVGDLHRDLAYFENPVQDLQNYTMIEITLRISIIFMDPQLLFVSCDNFVLLDVKCKLHWKEK